MPLCVHRGPRAFHLPLNIALVPFRRNPRARSLPPSLCLCRGLSSTSRLPAAGTRRAPTPCYDRFPDLRRALHQVFVAPLPATIPARYAQPLHSLPAARIRAPQNPNSSCLCTDSDLISCNILF